MTNPQNRRRDDVLGALPGTVVDISRRIGCHRNTVIRWLAVLMAEGPERCVYIMNWERRIGSPAPVYAKGNQPNAPCQLVRLTQAQRTENWKRNAQAAGRWELILRRRAWMKRASKATYLRDPLQAWLYRPTREEN